MVIQLTIQFNMFFHRYGIYKKNRVVNTINELANTLIEPILCNVVSSCTFTNYGMLSKALYLNSFANL